MAMVRLLPEQLVNQIAAGEVVERPASVLKELMENALDAGARSIRVELVDGGLRRIRVTDDGCGMAPEDAEACLERHATSKLTDLEGLHQIATMGFRGEAIPAIASVSRFTLLTRPEGTAEGTRIEVTGGKLDSRELAGAPIGTSVTVEDLFFNTPARRKFMKRPETEAGHASDTFVRLALANPGVAFSLESGGRSTYSMAASPKDPRERIASALGSEIFRHLLPIDSQSGAITLSGYMASPDYSLGTQRGIYTFVNRRFVRDRGLMAAIQRAFGEVLPAGRYPAVVLFLELPFDAVDVNVHPQKTEVRFAESRAVFEAVLRGIQEGLRTSPWLEVKPAPGPAPVPYAPYVSAPAPAPVPWSIRESEFAPIPNRTEALLAVAAPAPSPSEPTAEVAPEPLGYFSSLRYIGQFATTYLVCEAPGGELVVLDQHAAHERLKFHALREAYRAREPKVQRFLFPERVELSLAQARALAAQSEEVERIGFEIEPFGGNAVAVKAAPLALLGAPLARLLGDIADELMETGKGRAADQAIEHLLATLACHGSVRAHQTLDAKEAQALLRGLDGIDFNSRCPHGRPVAARIAIGELEREVGRR